MARRKPSTSRTGKGKKSAKPRLHLRRGKPLGHELRKIAIQQVEAAIRELHGNNVSPDPVHNARTYIKKVRAILQLASPAMSKKQREEPTTLLREAALRLAPLRDSEVRVRTLDTLLEQTGLPADDYASLRAGLADVAKQHRHNDARQIPRVLGFLGKLRDSIDDWPLEDLQGGDLKRRVRRSYRRGRISLDLCSSTPEPEPFHLWRKQVKQLWYQLRITSPYWKNKASDPIAVMGRIGQLAGEERDLTLLGETLKQGPQGKASSLLLGKIAWILPRLRRKAVAEGLSFYGPRPRIFIGDLDL